VQFKCSGGVKSTASGHPKDSLGCPRTAPGQPQVAPGKSKKEPVPGGTPGCPDALSFLTAPGYPGSTVGALREEVIFLMLNQFQSELVENWSSTGLGATDIGKICI
jgi:hypothetical protein